MRKKINPKVAIVLVNYGQPELTYKCMTSIINSSYNNISIYIIDNNSQDSRSKYIFEKISYSQVHVIFSDVNNGFSAGNNIGIEAALKESVDYVMLLNNDTEIDKYMIENLIAYADKSTILSPKMYYYDQPNKIWFAGGKVDRLRGTFNHIGTNKLDVGQYNMIKDIPVTTGCCMLIPTDIIRDIGLLDEKFFMYCEDSEYSLRAIDAGYRIRFIPKAVLWHKVSSTSNPTSKMYVYYTNRNRFYMARRYKFGLIAKIYTILSRYLYYLYGCLMKNNYRYIKKAYRDYRHGVLGKVNLDDYQ